MKHFLLFILLFCAVFFNSWGKQVDPTQAKLVAANFLSLQGGSLKSTQAEQLVRVELKLPGEQRFVNQKSLKPASTELVYLFKKGNEGFVLVSGDDLAKPILGYSTTGTIDANDFPVNMLKWIEEYKRQIRFLRANPDFKNTHADSEWAELYKGEVRNESSTQSVTPLLTTTWNQAPYYNDLCPQQAWYSAKAVTGCVATAMAQVMKYHNYPKKGEGIHSYYHSNNEVTYGTLTANFGATNYDWNNMPNALNAQSTATQIAAVGTLMLHCGIGVDMNYGPETSGAFVIEEKSYGRSCAEYALKEFFGYKNAKGVERKDYNTSQWINLLKNELNEQRPILFAGFGGSSGHAFVADGYDGSNFFHMNWGWGGRADGYYSVDAFEPEDLGTGAGLGTYNDNQCVVIGVEPPGQGTSGNSELDLRLYSDIEVGEIYQLSNFSINVKVANYGENTISNAEVGAALFDEGGDFVEFVKKLSGFNLEGGYLVPLQFDSDGLSAYPGKYILGIYYKPSDGNWVAFDDGDFKNFINIEILSSFNEADIRLYDSIKVTPDPIITGKSVRVDTKLGNYSASTYNGRLGAGLFKPDGTIVQEIEVFSIGMEAQKWYEVWYENDDVKAEPGEYIIGLVHFPDGENEQYVVGAGEYANPIHVNVVEPPLEPDDFENNDDLSNVSVFSVNFEDNYDGFYTLNTNIHSESDVDYYAINLDPGYEYTILARVHDSYNSGLDDEEFTCDVIWAHSDNGEWSKMYDDLMDAPYKLDNGGVVYFGVLPYFEGVMGTYSIQVEVERKIRTQSDNVAMDNELKVYPNPVKGILHISAPAAINKVELINLNGHNVLQDFIVEQFSRIDVSTFSPGVYVLNVFYGDAVETKKIIIND